MHEKLDLHGYKCPQRVAMNQLNAGVIETNDSLMTEEVDSIWQRTFDAVPDLIFILDDQHRIVRANRTAAERLGCSPEWLVGQRCHHLMHDTERPPSFCPLRELLDDGQSKCFELCQPDVLGRFSVTLTPLTNERGETIGAVHVARDVNELYQSREKAKQKHGLTIAAMLDGLWQWDLKTDRVTYSDRCLKLLGYQRDEVVASLDFLKAVLYPDDADAYWAAVDQTFQDRMPHSIECRLLVKSGEPRWFLTRGQALWDADDRPTHMAGIIQDIDEQKQAQQALQAALDEITSLKDRLENQNVYLHEALRDIQKTDGIVGHSTALQVTLQQVDHVAATDASVLLLGETGTGKELFARAIHERSPRADQPLVKVNCASLPSSLIESELFGHLKGAFTGALTDRVGRFQSADGGTLLLDEIGELDLDLQSKLLRVLQEGEFERIGSNDTIRVDVRVIAATNRDLHLAMHDGDFRPDLYYRLSVFPIELPPLRDRREDIPLLVWHFINLNQHRLGKHIAHVPNDAMDRLVQYNWPGNIRELQNVIERAMILSSGDTLTLSESLVNLPIRPHPPAAAAPSEPEPTPNRPASTNNDAQSLAEIDRAHIIAVLDECDWKIKGGGNAAARLGLKPSTLRYRMKKLGIQRP
jgi:PAS domain S-box-containing protein